MLLWDSLTILLSPLTVSGQFHLREFLGCLAVFVLFEQLDQILHAVCSDHNISTHTHTHILYILSGYEVGIYYKNTSHPGNNLLVAKIQCHALQGHRSSKSSSCCCSIKATMWVWERTQHSVLIVFLFIFSLNKWALHWITGLNKKILPIYTLIFYFNIESCSKCCHKRSQKTNMWIKHCIEVLYLSWVMQILGKSKELTLFRHLVAASAVLESQSWDCWSYTSNTVTQF